MKLSVVIPCYNEQEVLPKTTENLITILKKIKKNNLISDYELIFVNDGSKDNTEKIITAFTKKNKRIKAIMFNSNFGHQSAILAGILNSTGQAVITIDADLQDPPKYIPEFVKEYKKGNDVVIGVRKDRSTDSFLKKFFAESFYKLSKFLGVPGEFNAGDFRLISNKVVLNLKEFPERNLYLRGLIPSMKFKTGKVFYKREKRFAGETHYPFMKSFDLALNGITSFSTKPLRIIGVLGFILFFISIILFLLVFYARFFTSSTIVGWSSIFATILFFNSLNFIFLSIIGEYIGKIYIETKQRPKYIIKEKLNFK